MARREKEQSTPKKHYSRTETQNLCRLCSQKIEVDHTNSVKLFHKPSLDRDLPGKILRTCGVIVSQDDPLPHTICRKCDRFVNKMAKFREECNANQTKWWGKTTAKRMHSTPSSSTCSPSSSATSAKVRTTTTGSRKQLTYAPPEQNALHKLSAYNKDIHQVTTTFLSSAQVENLRRAIDTKVPSAIAHVVYKENYAIVIALKQLILKDMDIKAAAFSTTKTGKSVLNDHTFQGMSDFRYQQVWNEALTHQPFLIDVLSAISKQNGAEPHLLKDEVKQRLSFIYSMLMIFRWNYNSLWHRVITVLLTEGGCGKQAHERLQRLGVCLSPNHKSVLLSIIGGHFKDKVVEGLRNGKRYRGSGDNWDIYIRTGQFRRDRGNTDLHLFASNFIENRLSFQHLPNITPKHDIQTLPLSTYSVNGKEWLAYRETAKVIIARVMIDFLPYFRFLKEVIPDHIQHQYSDLLSKKSTIMSMPIIDANEQNYEDCVEILRTYERWIGKFCLLSP